VSLLFWIPALAIALALWVLSSTPDLAIASGTLDVVLRKSAHVAAFGTLALAALLALRRAHRLPWPRALTGAAAMAIAYAVVDEVHQSRVPTRVGAPSDVAFDALGVGLAIGAAAGLLRRRSA
jgi:VanZ family protein